MTINIAITPEALPRVSYVPATNFRPCRFQVGENEHLVVVPLQRDHFSLTRLCKPLTEVGRGEDALQMRIGTGRVP
jgi:hypothetical protein